MKTIYLFIVALLFSAGTLHAQFTTQDFEGNGTNLPTGWASGSASAGSDGWQVGIADSAASNDFGFTGNATSFAWINDDGCNCDMSADTLMSETFNLNGTATQIQVDVDVAYTSGSYQGAEESLTLMYSTDNGASWTAHVQDMQTSGTSQGQATWASQTYVINLAPGTSTMKLGFLYDDDGGWVFGAGIDNLSVAEFSGPENEAGILFTEIRDYEPTSISDHSVRVESNGGATINSITFETSIDGGMPTSNTVSGLNIGFGETENVDVPISLTAGIHDIDVSIAQVNGAADGDASNNTLATRTISAISNSAPRQALIEQATGAWCGWCPDGKLRLQDAMNNANINGATWHQGDPLEINAFSPLNSEYISGYPSGMINRTSYSIPTADPFLDLSRSNWNSAAVQSVNDPTPFTMSISHDYDTTSREVVVDLSTEITADVLGEDYRFVVYVVEDSIYAGSNSNLYQNNYYSSTSVGPNAAHPYYGLPNPVQDYWHLQTVRTVLGGTWGEQGSLPSTFSIGDVHTHQFTYTLPANYKQKDVKLVGAIVRYENGDFARRYVMNSASQDLDTPTITGVRETMAGVNGLQVQPNPTSGVATVNFSLANATQADIVITDLTGRTIETVASRNFLAGDHVLAFDASTLSNGVYMVSMKGDNAFSTVKFIKQ